MKKTIAFFISFYLMVGVFSGMAFAKENSERIHSASSIAIKETQELLDLVAAASLNGDDVSIKTVSDKLLTLKRGYVKTYFTDLLNEIAKEKVNYVLMETSFGDQQSEDIMNALMWVSSIKDKNERLDVTKKLNLLLSFANRTEASGSPYRRFGCYYNTKEKLIRVSNISIGVAGWNQIVSIDDLCNLTEDGYSIRIDIVPMRNSYSRK